MDKKLKESGIKDALLYPLEVIEAKGGPVMRMLRPDTPLLPDFKNGFGEIYFSEILPGAIKAWKLHLKQTQLFAVPMGQIKIVLYDTRADSRTLGAMSVLALGRPDNYNLLRIPPAVWYGFQAISATPALICNCADLPHDPQEAQRLPYNDSSIPYNWDNPQ